MIAALNRRSDLRFDSLVGLADAENFPIAFFAFLEYMSSHKPAALRDTILSPVSKGLSTR